MLLLEDLSIKEPIKNSGIAYWTVGWSSRGTLMPLPVCKHKFISGRFHEKEVVENPYESCVKRKMVLYLCDNRLIFQRENDPELAHVKWVIISNVIHAQDSNAANRAIFLLYKHEKWLLDQDIYLTIKFGPIEEIKKILLEN